MLPHTQLVRRTGAPPSLRIPGELPAMMLFVTTGDESSQQYIPPPPNGAVFSTIVLLQISVDSDRARPQPSDDPTRPPPGLGGSEQYIPPPRPPLFLAIVLFAIIGVEAT